MDDMKLCVNCCWHRAVETGTAIERGHNFQLRFGTEHQCHHPKNRRDPDIDLVTGGEKAGAGREFVECEIARENAVYSACECRLDTPKTPLSCGVAGHWFEPVPVVEPCKTFSKFEVIWTVKGVE